MTEVWMTPSLFFLSLLKCRAIDLAGSTVGIAFTSTMCSTSSVSISQDTGAGTFSTAAHELGHIMNMDHDDGSRYSVI